MTPDDPNVPDQIDDSGTAPNPQRSYQPGAPYVALGAPVPNHSFRLGAILAVILVTGVVIVGVLLAAAYLLRAESATKPPVVNVKVAAAPAADTATPIPTVVPRDAATARDTATTAPTVTPKATSTPVDTATTQPTDVPQDTPTPAPNDGVSVCTDSHYDHPNVVCNQTDSSLGPDEYTSARLVVTGPQGGTFQHNTLLFILSVANSEGSYSQLGTATDTVPVADTSESNVLSWLFDSTSTTPSFDGSTYMVEVDSGDVSLGSFNVTLTATGQPAAADTPTDVPPSSNTDYTATDACQGATTATDAVIRFYRAISLQQYAAAYQCFDAARQAGSSFSAWAAGYSMTASSNLLLAHLQPDGTVWLYVQSVDRENGSLLARNFVGTWSVDDSLRLRSAHIKELSHVSVSAVPALDISALFAFDNAVVLSDTTATVTGSFNSDEIVVTKTADCGACTIRRLLIYSGGMLVFSTKFLDGINAVQPDASGIGFTVVTAKSSFSYLWTPAGFESN